MLAIRLQRTGRHGHAQFRVVVQDSRQAPSSGKVIALLGSYNPHTKTSQITKDQAELYLKNGAQPSDRVARLFEQEGIKLPTWVDVNTKKTGTIRHSDKLRRNRPAEEAKAPESAEAPEPSEAAKAEELAATVESETAAEVSDKPAEADSKEVETSETASSETPEPESKQEKEEPKAATEQPAPETNA